MSNNYEPQWGSPTNPPQRGPSFDDPTQPSSFTTPTPVPEQPVDGTDHWMATDTAPTPVSGYDSASPHGSDPSRQGWHYGPQPYADQDPYGQQYANPSQYAQQYSSPGPYAAQGPAYGVYGGYSPHAYAQPLKSKVTAALLAFFLGGIGAHNFYLGKNTSGLIHVGIVVGAVLLLFGGIAAAASGDSSDAFLLLAVFGYLGLIGNNIWAFVEFIIILVKPEHELGH